MATTPVQVPVRNTAPETSRRPAKRQGADDVLVRAVAFAVTLGLHTGVAAAVLYGSLREKHLDEVVDPPIMVDVVGWDQLPKLGIERDKKALPRIVQAPLPEPAPAAPVNLNQEREEEPDEPREKTPEDENDSEREDPETLKKQEEQARKKRNAAIARAMAQFDARADEDSPEGLADGYAHGTSTTAVKLREEALWAAQVGARIHEVLQSPAGISPGECRRLSTVIPIVLNRHGQVANDPLVIKEVSGNGFFDDAALRAVKVFTPDGTGTLPLPDAEKIPELRKLVMKKGVPVRLECAE